MPRQLAELGYDEAHETALTHSADVPRDRAASTGKAAAPAEHDDADGASDGGDDVGDDEETDYDGEDEQ